MDKDRPKDQLEKAQDSISLGSKQQNKAYKNSFTK